MSLLVAALAATCALPDGWNKVQARHPKYVIFGETHGTEQEPALVGQVACALAKRGERLLVAIEQDAIYDAALQRAWAEPDSSFAAALRAYPGWRGRNDGVGSIAMFDLLVRLHRLTASGDTVDVVAFNGPRDRGQEQRFAKLLGQGPHEAAQADNLQTATARKTYDRVLVLAGAFHARKQPIKTSAGTFDAMGRRLAHAGQTVSLYLLDGGGTTWGCAMTPGLHVEPGQPVLSDTVHCGVHAISPTATLGVAPVLRMGDPPETEQSGDYDGYVWVGRVTASPPVDAPVAP